ncbi:MAG: hypothetical protein JST12_02040 [Armatimonadetes bacterium]|nr:hypothetical protein [Armatimonadota bacterium]
MLEPNQNEQARRDEVMRRILECVREDRRVALPVFDPSLSRPSDQFALLSIGLEPNDFSGTLGVYRYQFEGEEDLLHLIVTRDDQGSFSAEEAQAVASFVLLGVPTALIWLRPGEFSHHFYFGHDDLLAHVSLANQPQ